MKLPLGSAWTNMMSEILNSKNPNVCLLHIENRLKDEGLNWAKLECIRSLSAKWKRIIIVSALHPVYFREMLRAKTAENVAESYDHAIGSLPVIIKPLVKYGNPPTEEYSYTDFLWNLHNKLSFASERLPQKLKRSWHTTSSCSRSNQFLIIFIPKYGSRFPLMRNSYCMTLQKMDS